ncbi:helix-turn-helix domain-containing protein [Shewanella sp. 3B26]|uniref:Helix-turn-helix domain-containing protein n=1 Tax=Shewanella zhuhaiensis TaxID=2919576 RepID=A0AAJ1BIS3_9GAMM|nr:helix-turn-helix transcriptional regulator [Shewanella zhuhaiensis]MCH4295601.1 helix-turn-helix domain-containing protein [Shewanella zhuhaiensis]
MTWLEVMAEQAELHGQKAVANKLGISRTTVSQVLSGKYPGDMERMRKLVEGAYMNRTVLCPVLGEIPLNECLANQRNTRTTGNPIRIKLYRACRAGCGHSSLEVDQVFTVQSSLVSRRNDYDADGTIRRLMLQAGDDKPQLIALLKTELKHLGARFNRAMKEKA